MRSRRRASFEVQHGCVAGGVPDIDKYLSPEFAEAAVKQFGERK